MDRQSTEAAWVQFRLIDLALAKLSKALNVNVATVLSLPTALVMVKLNKNEFVKDYIK